MDYAEKLRRKNEKYRTDPKFRARELEKSKAYYRAHREQILARKKVDCSSREYHRKRYAIDPEFRADRIARAKEYYRKHRKERIAYAKRWYHGAGHEKALAFWRKYYDENFASDRPAWVKIRMERRKKSGIILETV